MQTILGSGGVIGRGLAHELTRFTSNIRLVSRHPQAVNAGDQCVSADLRDAKQVDAAVAGSAVAYLTVGLRYDIRVWESEWPLVMRNVIDACRRHGAKLVFFDNVYVYGLVDGPMTETTPARPCSRKGEVRGRVAAMLLEEMAAGRMQALIARSADFYGPGATNTFVHPMVFEKLLAGKKAAWLCDDRLPHAMTYTPDAARGTALLGNADDGWGEIWHLPTHAEPPTGRQFIEQVAEACGTRPDYQVLRPWMLKLVALFNPLVRESAEMLYQYTHPYHVDSSRFEARFFAPTSYENGIRETVAWLRQR
ncbi:MAG: NAD-dependent epimerase/dehydratase family protein [Chromatiales bacterium]|nr:NAD-dependent epimerase/dehydratase family protein [Chromatiales bacterium]